MKKQAFKTKPFDELKKNKLTPEDITEIEWQVYHEKNMLEFLEIASKTRNDTVKWINIINACNNYEVLTEDNRRGYATELGEILGDFDAIIFKMDKVILKYKEVKEYYEEKPAKGLQKRGKAPRSR